ncbi:hypothetical protein [Fusibacter sp. 3D3]|uniref:hypothetical protein n=1 Tax=Fusibacter sp. 3D3 TaxID=1048380 RepID=UPI001112FF47|nr:hypothetical protein [Fusibacter sp. 3D3]
MKYSSYSKTLSTVSYKQFDTRWKSLFTSCGGTMGQQGCAITSCSMIFNVQPDVHLSEMKAHDGADCPYQWSTGASLKNKIYSATTGSFNSLKAAMFENIITNELPMVVAVPDHFIVVQEFVGTLPMDPGGGPIYSSITSDMFTVNDPGSSYNFTLQDVINQKGPVSRIGVFKQ